MAIARLDSGVNTAQGVPTITVTLPLGAPAAGDLLVASGVIRGNTTAQLIRAGWTALPAHAQDGHSVAVSYKAAEAGDPAAMEFTYNTTQNRVFVARFGGFARAPLLDVTGTANTADPSIDVTPTPGPETLLVISTTINEPNTAVTPVAPLIELDEGLCAGGFAPLHWCAYRVVDPAAGTYTLAGTRAPPTPWGSGIRATAFQAAAAVAGVRHPRRFW